MKSPVLKQLIRRFLFLLLKQSGGGGKSHAIFFISRCELGRGERHNMPDDVHICIVLKSPAFFQESTW